MLRRPSRFPTHRPRGSCSFSIRGLSPSPRELTLGLTPPPVPCSIGHNAERHDVSAYIPRAARYRLEVPLRYRVAGSNRWQEGQTVNVSGTGALVQVAEFLAPEILFEMVLRIPPEVGKFPAGDLVCLGKLTRRSPDMAPPGGYLVAGTFIEFRSADWSSPSGP